MDLWIQPINPIEIDHYLGLSLTYETQEAQQYIENNTYCWYISLELLRKFIV